MTIIRVSYFTSYLQVVYHLSISTAGYISSIYDVVAAVWMFPVGYLIRRTGQYKWLLYIGACTRQKPVRYAYNRFK